MFKGGDPALRAVPAVGASAPTHLENCTRNKKRGENPTENCDLRAEDSRLSLQYHLVGAAVAVAACARTADPGLVPVPKPL